MPAPSKSINEGSTWGDKKKKKSALDATDEQLDFLPILYGAPIQA